MFLVIIPVVSLVSLMPMALVLIVIGVRIILGTRRPVDLDDLAGQIVRLVAKKKAFTSPTVAVVPVVGRPGAFHVILTTGRRERIVTAASLAMVHTLVLGHLMTQYA